MHERPLARTQGVFSEPVDGEVVIYDRTNEMSHCLSADAAAVWRLCDGNRSAQDIAKELEKPIESVSLALAQLAEAKLLEQDQRSARHYSRRDFATRAGKLGGAAMAAPLIYSVAIPPAAFAASGSPNGTSQTSAQCPAAAGARAADANCASHTCYQDGAGQGTRFCVSATCHLFGTACTTFADCCAGQSSDPRHTMVCPSGTCVA